jgi:hypothetical protein
MHLVVMVPPLFLPVNLLLYRRLLVIHSAPAAVMASNA